MDPDKTQLIVSSTNVTPAPAAKLACLEPDLLVDVAKAEIELSGKEVTIGSGPRNSVRFKEPGVPESHMIIFPGSGTWGIEDAGSDDGVIVNKSKISRTWLKPNDIVSIAGLRYRYRLLSDIDSEDDETIIPGVGKQPSPARNGKQQSATKPATSVSPAAAAQRSASRNVPIIVGAIVVVLALAALAAWKLV